MVSSSTAIAVAPHAGAWTYLILIAMMALSVVEQVVRREMKQEKAEVIGPGGVRMTQPTLRAIVGIFYNATVTRIRYAGKTFRSLAKPLNDSQQKILRYLGLTEGIFFPPPSDSPNHSP